MSYGRSEKPCDNYKHWPSNEGLCGRCGWEKQDHKEKDIPGSTTANPDNIKEELGTGGLFLAIISSIISIALIFILSL